MSDMLIGLEGWPGVFRPLRHYVANGASRLLVRGALVVFAVCNLPCRPPNDSTADLPWCPVCRRHLDTAAQLSTEMQRMAGRHRNGGTQMTTRLLVDAAERFVLGTRNGVVTPTAEPVSDTDVTPFGLTLRTAPTRRNVVRVRSADGVITMATDKVTTYETDGSGDGSDTQVDYTSD